MNDVTRYADMKDSGVEWIGKIPSHWETSTIGALYELRSEKVSDKDYPPLSVTQKGILHQLESVAKTDDGDNRKLVCKNDFVINSRSDRRGSCGISPYTGSVSLINIVLNPKNKMNHNYYNWLFHSEMFSDEFYKWGRGIVDDLWTTRWSEMKKINIPVPPLSMQSDIASYLDDQCAKIDDLIEEARSSIEEYKKWKASVIYEAVTKGLDPHVEMKDSGVEWIGKIPKHWKAIKAKFLVSIENGSDPVSEGDIPVYGSGSSSFKTCGESKKFPSVLLGRKGATLHIPHYINEPFWNVDTAFNVYVKNNNILLIFYYYCSICFDYKYYISATTLPSMTQTNYKGMVIPIPTINEQHEIVFYLDTKCSEIDQLISEKAALIADLEKYKKSLIYEVVTGKRMII